MILENEYGVIKGQNTGRKNPPAEVEIVRKKIKASDSWQEDCKYVKEWDNTDKSRAGKNC